MPTFLSELLSTTKGKLILLGFVVFLLLIPTSMIVISQRLKASTPPSQQYNQTVTSNTAKEVPRFAPKGSPKPPAGDINSNTSELSDIPESSQTAQLSFGPTLAFDLNLEGRPANNQAGQVFLGIAAGAVQINPTYLLSFLINIGSDGAYHGLSLSGLEIGQNYTAYIKGTAQIATSSAFTVKPAFNNLGGLNLVSGDLNEDNMINSADYAISKAAIGTTPASSNWNANIDINKDNLVNVFDVSFIVKNLNQTGAGGAWGSTPPSQLASQSASLNNCHPELVSGSNQIPKQVRNDSCASLGNIGVDINSVIIQPKPKVVNPTPSPSPLPEPKLNKDPQSPLVVPAEDGDWVFLPRN